jgi:threonine 3-dehydrogenase
MLLQGVEKMKALVKTGKAPGLELKDVAVPGIGPNDVLIKVKATSICGSDIHIFKSSPGYMRGLPIPTIIGHETCGEVIEVGEYVTSLKKGDIVSPESLIFCGECYYCKMGLAHHCQNRKILGVSIDGTLAEYARVPAICCWKHPEDISPDLGAIYEPIGVAVHGVLADEVNGKSVAVFGCGPIGLFAIGAAKAFGAAQVFALEVASPRIALARQLFPDITVINPREQDAAKTIINATDGLGVDVSLEISGSAEALRQAFKVLKSEGRLSMVGVPAGPIELDTHPDIIRKGVRVFGVIGHVVWKTLWQVRTLLETDKFDPARVITHRFPLAEFEEAFKLAVSGEAGKIVLYP